MINADCNSLSQVLIDIPELTPSPVCSIVRLAFYSMDLVEIVMVWGRAGTYSHCIVSLYLSLSAQM